MVRGRDGRGRVPRGGAGPGPTFSWVMTSRGTVAMTAITAAAPAAAAAARVALRRRARFLISSKVPGGGGSGCT